MKYYYYSPLMASLFPSVLMLAANIHQASGWSAWRLAVVSIPPALLITSILIRITHNPPVAGLTSTLLVLAWGCYGWIEWSALMVLVLVVYLLIKKPRITRLIPWLNGAVTLPVAFFAAMVMPTTLERDTHLFRHAGAAGTGRDVYFIVLDSYTGASVMLDRFGLDDPLPADLRSLGFQSGECSSHADKTERSLAYLLSGAAAGGWKEIRSSQLRLTLEGRGYQTWAFSTGFIWTEIMDADRYMDPEYGMIPTATEALVLLQTPLSLLPLDLVYVGGARYRLRTQNILDHLADAAHDDRPQFVFAHIIQPHPPFVYAADGSETDPTSMFNPVWWSGDQNAPEYLMEVYQAGYVEQVQFISQALLPVLREIITRDPDSQIILTGDHGAWYPRSEAETFSVLCATYGLEALEARAAVLEIMK